MDLRQVFVSFGDEIYNAIFNYDKLVVFYKVEEKDKYYVFPKFNSGEIHDNLGAFLRQYHNGKIKKNNFFVLLFLLNYTIIKQKTIKVNYV